MKTEADLVFQAIRRIQQDITNSLNPAAIGYAHRKCVITNWEYKFYNDIWRKQKLYPKQLATKIKINKVVLRRFRKDHTKTMDKLELPA
jgi:ABC-type dipeptide/oligopeptide/nickel transport system ATPase subunit